jgi:hypothetical protein
MLHPVVNIDISQFLWLDDEQVLSILFFSSLGEIKAACNQFKRWGVVEKEGSCAGCGTLLLVTSCYYFLKWYSEIIGLRWG